VVFFCPSTYRLYCHTRSPCFVDLQSLKIEVTGKIICFTDDVSKNKNNDALEHQFRWKRDGRPQNNRPTEKVRLPLRLNEARRRKIKDRETRRNER
jgi:hypothetical protein